MPTITDPYTFANGIGQTASGTQVNERFNPIYNLVNGLLDAANLADNAVGTSEIAASAVTSAKMATNSVLAAAIGTLPRAKVKRAAAQSISNGTETVFAFDTEEFDTDNMHDNTTNNNRITIVTAGLYQAGLLVNWVAATGVQRQIALRKNGVSQVFDIEPVVSGSVGVYTRVQSPFEMAVGDYFDATGVQDSGGSLNANPIMWALFVGK